MIKKITTQLLLLCFLACSLLSHATPAQTPHQKKSQAKHTHHPQKPRPKKFKSSLKKRTKTTQHLSHKKIKLIKSHQKTTRRKPPKPKFKKTPFPKKHPHFTKKHHKPQKRKLYLKPMPLKKPPKKLKSHPPKISHRFIRKTNPISIQKTTAVTPKKSTLAWQPKFPPILQFSKKTRFPTSFFMTLHVGPTWTSPGQTQTFYLQPDIQKTYQATNSQQTLFNSELFFGFQLPLAKNMLSQLGLSVGKASTTHLNGSIWEDADSTFNNYFYTYQVEPLRLALKGKLLATHYRLISPYLSGSVGLGFNRASQFTITPKIIEEVAAPFFTDNTETTLSYSFGIGVQTPLRHHFQAILGYEWINWGKSQLSKAPGQTLNSGLALNHLYTNGVYIGLQYTSAA